MALFVPAMLHALAPASASTRLSRAFPHAKAAAACTVAPNWGALVLAHRVRYPVMALTDAFKLLQQATLGSEHAIGDEAMVLRWMDREWATMRDGPREALVDTLGTPARFVRIHLRPWRDSAREPLPLTTAFIATGRGATPDTAQLSCAIMELAALARARRVPWPADSIGAAARAWAARGYPAVEHSPAYESRYKPAYRVVAIERVQGLLRR